MRAAAARPSPAPSVPDDGKKLEDVIGELQSIWGVPQYPQEFRITVKVAEERGSGPPDEPPVSEIGPTGVMRERAPAAPRVAPASQSERAVEREQAPRRRRRPRRGRRRGGRSNDGG